MGLLAIELLCLLFVLPARAQELKVHVNQKGKIGYADASGSIVIPCKYDYAKPFEEGYAIVGKSDKKGIINAAGKEVLPIKYIQIRPWSRNLYLIDDGNRKGLATRQGKIVLSVVYSMISNPNCYGKALLAKGGKATASAVYQGRTYMADAKFGIVDTLGNICVLPKYKGLFEFAWNPNGALPYYEGRRLLAVNHYFGDTLLTDCEHLGFAATADYIKDAGIVTGDGKEVIKRGQYSYVMKPQNDMVRYYISKKKSTTFGYHDLRSGKSYNVFQTSLFIDNIKFWSHGDFIGDMAPVNGTTAWSFINRQGQTIRTGFNYLRHGATVGLWAAKRPDSTFVVFDDANHDVSALTGYNDILFPRQQGDREVMAVKKNGKWGCIDRQGNTVCPMQYDVMTANSYDYFAVKKDGKWGLLSATGAQVIPVEYRDIVVPVERHTRHVWVQKADTLFYHYQIDKKQVAKTGYRKVSHFKDGFALVVPKNWGDETYGTIGVAMSAPVGATTDKIGTNQYIKNGGWYGHVISTDDVEVIARAVSALYFDRIVDELNRLGMRTPTAAQQKALLMRLTAANRYYPLSGTIDNEEWDF